MNGRYSPTERIGVNAVERIVIEELGWIFREQPIVDVGVDAIIEQCEDGNPTGRFIAVQIKSGESNFSISRNWLTYYTSHTHYHYWLNLNIPIILAAHIPKSGRTYWQRIFQNQEEHIGSMCVKIILRKQIKNGILKYRKLKNLVVTQKEN